MWWVTGCPGHFNDDNLMMFLFYLFILIVVNRTQNFVQRFIRTHDLSAVKSNLDIFPCRHLRFFFRERDGCSLFRHTQAVNRHAARIL